MQKQQVFKVKGMQRDASMANANGEFAYELLNMRLMPAEDLSGFSLTNEKGTTQVITGISGQVIGQCPTNDSLVFFTCDPEGADYIYELYQEEDTWELDKLFQGNLNFSLDHKIEAIFNYETLDIQKVYWIDGIHQLRCINIVESPTNWGMKRNADNTNWEPDNVNNQYFDSVKEVNSLPNVEIERVSGGSFTAGVIQYYVTYFKEFSTESPIVYTSPLLYIAHSNRGANVNDQVSTAFKLTLSNLDITNWGYIRIYATHRTSLDATPEGSIITELKMLEGSTIEFTDYGSNRTSIAPTDLYYIGSKFVKAGTMTAKDQVMFLGNLEIAYPEVVSHTEIQSLFNTLRESGDIDNFFSTETRKQKENRLSKYEDTNYYYKNHLSNTESITHYKYGEKYRFGISVMDKYGVWSNPIWIKDEFILVPPEQVDANTLELPCPSLNLSGTLSDIDGIGGTPTLWEYLQSKGVKSIKPLVVFPKEDERKVIAQGVVCPTVYNLKDRQENGPYAQASWFMRPNVPVDLWGFSADELGKGTITIVENVGNGESLQLPLSHKSDLYQFQYDGWDTMVGYAGSGYYGAGEQSFKYTSGLSPFDYIHDDFSATVDSELQEELRPGEVIPIHHPNGITQLPVEVLTSKIYTSSAIEKIVNKGAWLEFRHNYSLRSPGWSFGIITPKKPWNKVITENTDWGMTRMSELDTSDFNNTMPVNIIHTSDGGSTEEGEIMIGSLTYANTVFATKQSPSEVNKIMTGGGQVNVQIIHRDSMSVRATYNFVPNEFPSWDTSEYAFYLQNKENSQSVVLTCPTGVEKVIYVNDSKYYEWFADQSNIALFLTIEKETLGGEFEYIAKESRPYPYGNRTIDNLNTGNSAYYVDNSIITLNSPEVELSSNLHQQSIVGNFRIIGMIPLTATSSDISLEVNTPTENPKNLTVGLTKVALKNTNIGYHGFKGIIAANAYHSYYKTYSEFPYYGLVPLSPWHSTGSLSYYSNDDVNGGSKNLLKRKILSNLRFSASSYYFPHSNIIFADNVEDKNYLEDNIIGWQPTNGCEIIVAADSSIYKFQTLSYPNYTSPVYKKDIDSIALLSAGELGEIPKDTKIFSLGQGYEYGSYESIHNRLYAPATSSKASKKTKSAKGAAIKYKSSPHFVVGFKPFNSLWSSSLTVQETLPTLRFLNEEGLPSNISQDRQQQLAYHRLFDNPNVAGLYHQDYLTIAGLSNFGGLNKATEGDDSVTRIYGDDASTSIKVPNYGWLWLGEIYRETDPTFGGTSDYALQNNQWENASTKKRISISRDVIDRSEDYHVISPNGIYGIDGLKFENTEIEISSNGDDIYMHIAGYDGFGSQRAISLYLNQNVIQDILDTITYDQTDITKDIEISAAMGDIGDYNNYACKYSIEKVNGHYNLLFTNPINILIEDIKYSEWPKKTITSDNIFWTIGDTYYQRFDTLKTYAYSDSDQNSVIDITSFMVETRVNIDGRYDRNRGQENNLQMSPTNFNLMNDVYSQRDNFFTYRILDDNVQARTKFHNQITWSLTKTAGATGDAWMNITLASVLDLDGTKGELTALKNFNNNIIAFQEKGLSHIMFNSRAQIATSEAVPIQIANTGKVDGQQYFTTDVGCQDKWNIVTTPNGLYFVDYFKNSIYRFNGQLEDISTPNGFRSWCYENLNSTANIIGYYDVKNKEVMYYIGDTRFKLDNNIKPTWLGFSELTGAFSSFYTYPKAWFDNVQDQGLWLLSDETGTTVFTHQTGNYNQLLGATASKYGLTVIPRQDSNTVKTFNNVEFRADFYNSSTLDDNYHFDTISAETEYQTRTPETLTYSQYRPSNLKKKFRTWRANIPRVNNGYNRFVNQWAKIGLWKMNPSTEKTILHDLSVWYSE